jgi:hypothetical protein
MKGPQAKLSRRTFLFAASAGTAATAAAVIAKKQIQATPEKESGGPSGKGYQLTEHVRNYYRTTKI